MFSRAGRRPKKDLIRAAPNAMDGGSYYRNLYSVLRERDIGSVEFSTWLSGEIRTPAVTARHLEKWLKTTKAAAMAWPHRGSGAEILDPDDEMMTLHPRAPHVGVREGHVYRLVLGMALEKIGSTREKGGSVHLWT